MVNGAKLLEAIYEIASEKQIDVEIIKEGIVEGFQKAFERFFDTEAVVIVDIDESVGSIRMYQELLVVDEVEDDWLEVELKEAKKIDPTAQVGEKIKKEILFSEEFGRSAVGQVASIFRQKIRTAERGIIYRKFIDREGEIVRAKVVGKDEAGNTYILDIDGIETGLWVNKTINNEEFESDEYIDVLLEEVSKESKYSQLLVSRVSPKFLQKLLEREIPEVSMGLVGIAGVSREPGRRAKVAVYSTDENIEPVGTIIGPRGSRINKISTILKGEKIDVVKYDENLHNFILNAMSPVRVISVNEVEGEYDVVVPTQQLSLAIGRGGSSARLAANLLRIRLNIDSLENAEQENVDILWNGNITKEEVESGSFLEKQNRPTFANDSFRQSTRNKFNNTFYLDELQDFQAQLEEEDQIFVTNDSSNDDEIKELSQELDLDQIQANLQAFNETEDEEAVESDEDNIDDYDKYYE